MVSGPPSGQMQVIRAAGLFDRSDRGVLDIEGKGVLAALDKILSSHVAELTAHRGQRSVLLTARGRIVGGFHLFLLPSGAVRLVLGEEVRPELRSTLEKYCFLGDLLVTDRTGETAFLGLEGPRAARAIEAAGIGRPDALPAELLGLRWEEWKGVPLALTRKGETPEGGFEIWAPRSQLEELRAALLGGVHAVGGGACSAADADALRIEAGIARLAVDGTGDNFPNDLGWEDALTYDKCYVGQEIVARMRTYGQANRKLRGLLVDRNEAGVSVPRLPAPLLVEGEEAGQVTSLAPSDRLGVWVGLATVRRKYWGAGSARVGAGEEAPPCRLQDLPLVRLDVAPATS